MNILQDRRLSRRHCLKGIGACLSLPYLEAMWPKAGARAAAAPSVTSRVGMFYFGIGMNTREFFPKESGKDYRLTQILEPLADFKDDFTVLSGTWLENGGAHQGQHAFGTGYGPKGDKGISADQLAAAQLGRDSRFESLILSEIDTTGVSSAFSHNAQGIPMVSESDPVRVFDKLFRPIPTDRMGAERTRLDQRGSVLDSVMTQAKQLEQFLGKTDREQVDQYFNSIRETEKRLEKAKEWLDRPKPEPDTEGMEKTLQFIDPENAGTENHEQHAKLMYDLIALAWQTDSTRVVSHIVRRELSGGGNHIRELYSVSGNYHDLTHHNNKPEKLADLAKVDVIYMKHWAYFLERLRSTPEGESNLLDNSVLGFSSGMGMDHAKDMLPTVMTGGRALGVEHQGHLVLSENTPLARMWHTMLDRAGVETPENFQDSSGPITQLLA